MIDMKTWEQDVLKEALKNLDKFKNELQNAIEDVTLVIQVEPDDTENHINRMVLLQVLKTTNCTNPFSFPDRIIENQGVNYSSIRQEYIKAVLAEWSNVANELVVM